MKYTPTILEPILPRSICKDRLLDDSLTRHLIFAICACSTNLSTHVLLQEPKSSEFGLQFSQQSRSELNGFMVASREVELLRTYCCLIYFAIMQADGSRAWVDIGTFLWFSHRNV